MTRPSASCSVYANSSEQARDSETTYCNNVLHVMTKPHVVLSWPQNLVSYYYLCQEGYLHRSCSDKSAR